MGLDALAPGAHRCEAVIVGSVTDGALRALAGQQTSLQQPLRRAHRLGAGRLRVLGQGRLLSGHIASLFG